MQQSKKSLSLTEEYNLGFHTLMLNLWATQINLTVSKAITRFTCDMQPAHC